MTRWCAVGDHFTKSLNFRVKTNGKFARDCKRCEEKKRNNRRRNSLGLISPFDPNFPGVDMDRIHHLRGAVVRA